MQYTNGRYKLTKAELAALLPFASKDETRLALHGVYFEPAKGRCVATDGHTLVTVDADVPQNIGGETPTFLISREDLEQAKRWIGKRGQSLYIACPVGDGPAYLWAVETDNVGRESIIAERECPRLDASCFPHYEQVIPCREHVGLAVSVIGVDAGLLKRLALIQNATETRGPNTIIRMPEDSLEPIVATARSFDGTEWRAVIMPARVDPDIQTSVAKILAEEKGEAA